MSERSLRVAIDVGGTFTDLFVIDAASGAVSVAKVPSTPGDPAAGVLNGIASAGVDLGGVEFVSHGTTVATNALITRNFPPTAMVTTKGFRDVIEIRRGHKDEPWDAYYDLARPYVPRRHRLGVRERIDWKGNVVEPLDEEEARGIARTLKRRGIASVAVCFMNSFMNASHEQRMREILEEELDGAWICTSAEVLPEIFEHERFSTTVVNSCVSPVIAPYVTSLSEGLAARGYQGDLLLFHSGGGVMTPAAASRLGARLAGSGIAAGAIACQRIAAVAGYRNAIGLDMGGTSTDISLVHDGQLDVTNDWYIEFGYPIGFPAIDIRTIGAGGGSLAWIDEGGSLRNGPQSAGANPGPACYGLGNRQATNTDANVVLGRLGTHLLGGAMTLDADAAEHAVATTVAEPLGMSVVDAAEAIVRIANANMADAVRVVSIRQGHDPRDFALVVFGGAGPLHGAELARELSIPTVIVPPQPGITSALGCLLVDVRHDLSEMILSLADDVESDRLETVFERLEREGTARLEAEGVEPAQRRLERSVSMRYLGQWRSIDLPVGTPAGDAAALVRSFHDEHERSHHFRRDGAPVEIYRANLTAIGTTPSVEFPRRELVDGTPTPRSTRTVHFGAHGAVETAVYWRDDLEAGNTIQGPAIIEQIDSTTVVPPDVTASVDAYLNIVMAIREG